MPEGPEVKHITNWLNKNYKNKTLLNIKIDSGRYKRHDVPEGWIRLKKNLPLKIIKISCYGKFIWWEFENDLTLWNTLGMSGWWNSDDNTLHNHITFNFDKINLYFNDIRNFGTIIICNQINLEKKINYLGPDILSKNNEYDFFITRLSKKRNNIKIAEALLDQKVLAGVGNYLRSDILWLSKISPHKRINDLTNKEKHKIYDNAKLLGLRAYKILTKQKLPKNLLIPNTLSSEFFIIYNNEFDPNGKKIIKEKIGNRSVYWVKN